MSQSADIQKFRRLANLPLVQGGMFSGLNLIDMYLLSKDRELVLDTLRERFPHATAELLTEQDWREKLSDSDVVGSYVNAFVGEHAEIAAMAFLANGGVLARQFDSRVHPDTDLEGDNGVDYSVKSYASDNLHNLRREIRESDADHYVINSEAYEGLQRGGHIELYEAQGIHIVDGGFSHDEYLALAFEHLEERPDDAISPVFDNVLDDIPIVGAIVAAASIGRAVVGLKQGALSRAEAVREIGTDARKFAVSGAGAVAGATTGAMIGSAVFPLTGTLIGGFLGGVAGAVGARSFVENRRSRNKWPASERAHKHFSETYRNGLSPCAKNQIKDILFHRQDILAELSRAHAAREANEPKRRWFFFRDQDLITVFLDEVLYKLKRCMQKANSQSERFARWIADYAIHSGISLYPDDKKRALHASQRIYGAILAENADWLLILSSEERSMLLDLEDEQRTSPNNPYQEFALDKGRLLREAAIQQFAN